MPDVSSATEELRHCARPTCLVFFVLTRQLKDTGLDPDVMSWGGGQTLERALGYWDIGTLGLWDFEGVEWMRGRDNNPSQLNCLTREPWETLFFFSHSRKVILT